MVRPRPVSAPVTGWRSKLAPLLFSQAPKVEMVDIYVGKYKKHYRVHKSILCGKVEYFKKMFNNGFKETLEQAATLPEADAEVFELFLEWVYRGAFHKSIDADEGVPTLIAVYGWAEHIWSTDLADYTATLIFSGMQKYGKDFNVSGIRQVYEVTIPESPLRKWAIRSLRRRIHFQDFLDGQDRPDRLASFLTENHECTLDLMQLMRKNGKVPDDPTDESVSVCRYHRHTMMEKCKFPVDLDLV